MKKLTLFLILTLAAAMALADAIETVPVYRFRSTKGNLLYKISPTVPAGLSDGPWANEGVVFHVAKSPNGMRPVYSLTKSDDLGVRFAYTKDPNESAEGWLRQEAVAFYVAPTQIPGTVPLYRLYAPLRHVGDTSPGGFSAPVPGTDAHFYTARSDERDQAFKAGWVSEGIVGYVWASAQKLPDLVVEQTAATDFSVTALIRNLGETNTSGGEYRVVLRVYDRKGQVAGKFDSPGPHLSTKQAQRLVFNTGALNLIGNQYQVTIDEAKSLAESNESNNGSPLMDGPGIHIKNMEGVVPPPAIRLQSAEPSPVPLAKERMRYVLRVSNWDRFPAEWFVKGGGALPPSACGDARMIAIVAVNGSKVGCEAIVGPSNLQTVEFTRPMPLDADDKIVLVLQDRLTSQTYESQPFSAGWLGIAALLHSAGCNTFLGREGKYLCNQQGMVACENLRKAGKPIDCTLVPKKK